MREILYKAKRIDNGEWVEGYLVKTRYNTYHDGYRIIDKDGINYDELDYYEPIFISYVIDESTICQYTGRVDKNGHKIWENDIAYMRCNGLSGYGRVVYENGCFWIDDKKRNRKYPFSNHDVKYRVDGNIFDNAELLERKE